MIFSLNEVKNTKFGILANALVMCAGSAHIANLDLDKIELSIKLNGYVIDFAKLVRIMGSSLKDPADVGPAPPDWVFDNSVLSSDQSDNVKSIVYENLENPVQLHIEILNYMKARDSEISALIKDIEDKVADIDISATLDSASLADMVESDLDNCISDILNTAYIRNIVRDILDDADIEPELCDYDVTSIQDQCEAVSALLID